jgi:hypothetical protein
VEKHAQAIEAYMHHPIQRTSEEDGIDCNSGSGHSVVFQDERRREKLTRKHVLESQGGILRPGHDLDGDLCDREHLQAP